MPVSSDYQKNTAGRWRLVYLRELWSSDAGQKILHLAQAQPWAKHPQTLPLRLALGANERELYLKVFHAGRGAAAWKDALRKSKALRGWRIGIDLEEAGFAAPLTIAAGEQRRAGLLRRAFLLTEKIAGKPAHVLLRDRLGSVGLKRALLRQAAAQLRRFHAAGFVHGDLVPTNLFIDATGREVKFYFMDNDRTRRYPPWLPQRFWKRNLVQLNRMPLPGITLQDRMRFFKAYLDVRELGARDRALLRWLERHTRRRRAACDGIDGAGDFRRLMRWSDEGSSAVHAK